MHELELRNSAHQNRMDILFLVEPVHQLSHHERHIVRRRRRIDRLSGNGVDHVILDFPVFARIRGSASDSFHQPLVDFPDQPFGDRPAVFEILGNEFERLFVVQKFPNVIRMGFGNRLACQELLGLFQRQARSLDVRGMVGFQDQSAAAHLTDPSFGQSSSLQKPSGPLNLGQPGSDPIGDLKDGLQGFYHFTPLNVLQRSHFPVYFTEFI